MFNKSHEFYKKVRENFYLSSQRFQIWRIISAITPKLCLLGQKYAGTWGVNTTIINLNQVSISENQLMPTKSQEE